MSAELIHDQSLRKCGEGPGIKLATPESVQHVLGNPYNVGILSWFPLALTLIIKAEDNHALRQLPSHSKSLQFIGIILVPTSQRFRVSK